MAGFLSNPTTRLWAIIELFKSSSSFLSGCLRVQPNLECNNHTACNFIDRLKIFDSRPFYFFLLSLFRSTSSSYVRPQGHLFKSINRGRSGHRFTQTAHLQFFRILNHCVCGSDITVKSFLREQGFLNCWNAMIIEQYFLISYCILSLFEDL